MELDRAARPLIEREVRCRHANLPGHVLDRGIRDLAPAARKPATVGIEAQQHREPQPRRPTLAGNQRQLVSDQRPAIDQLALIQLPRHARTLLLQPISKPEVVTTDNASYSDMVFGVFAILNYRFAPRFADLPDQRYWRAPLPDPLLGRGCSRAAGDS